MADKKTFKVKGQLRVLVVGGGYAYIRMFFDLGFSGAKTVAEADILCFTGGADVTPEFYGEEPLARTNFDRIRDLYEKTIYERALELGKPMVGICRGGQFLNVMNKGKMWQHVSNHAGDHEIAIVNEKGKTIKKIPVSSTHHQMMIPAEEGEVLAVAARADVLMAAAKTIEKKKPDWSDVEVVWYSKTKCLCFQPHPEFFSVAEKHPCLVYFEKCMVDYIL